MNNNPVFKGVGSLGVRQQINDRLNLGVNLEAPLLRNPVTGERIKQSPTAKFSLKYNFKDGGSLPKYQSKGEINTIFDPRYKEYKEIRKENENIESLNKEIDAAKDAYELRWSNVNDYTDSTQWKNTPQYLGFEKYKNLVPESKNITFSKTFKTGEDKKVYKGWGNTDWDAAKSSTIENYHRKLPRHSMTDDEYQQYISWAQTNNPEYFAEHNIEELLKGLPSQNIVVRSMINDLGYPTNNEESNFTINTDNIIEPQPTIEQVEQKQIEYKKLLTKRHN